MPLSAVTAFGGGGVARRTPGCPVPRQFCVCHPGDRIGGVEDRCGIGLQLCAPIRAVDDAGHGPIPVSHVQVTCLELLHLAAHGLEVLATCGGQQAQGQGQCAGVVPGAEEPTLSSAMNMAVTRPPGEAMLRCLRATDSSCRRTW